MTIINRIWAMPNKRTFLIPPIADLIKKYMPNWKYPGIDSILDPFPYDYPEDEDCLVYLAKHNSQKYGLYDPPYSMRQFKESYKGKGQFNGSCSVFANWKDKMAEKIKPGGINISFGWASTGLGKERGFEILEILIVCHGGCHYDTICTVERKSSIIQQKLLN